MYIAQNQPSQTEGTRRLSVLKRVGKNGRIWRGNCISIVGVGHGTVDREVESTPGSPEGCYASSHIKLSDVYCSTKQILDRKLVFP